MLHRNVTVRIKLCTTQNTRMCFKSLPSMKLNHLQFISWEMKYGVLFSFPSYISSYSFVENFSLNLFEAIVLSQLFNFSVLEIRWELSTATTCSFRVLRSGVTHHLRTKLHISPLFSIVTSRHLSLFDKWKIIFCTQSFKNRPSFCNYYFKPLKTKPRLLYLKTQYVPRSKHF